MGGSGTMALGTTFSACELGELCVCWCEAHTRPVQSDPLSASQFTLRKAGGPVGRMGALEGLVFPATSESSSAKHQRLPCSLQRCTQWLLKSQSSSTSLGICNCGILGCQVPETHRHHDVQNWFCPDTLLPSNLSRFLWFILQFILLCTFFFFFFGNNNGKDAGEKYFNNSWCVQK